MAVQDTRAPEYDFLEDQFIVDTDVHVAEPPGLISRYLDDPWDTYVGRFEERYRIRDTRGYMPGMELGTPITSAKRERPELTDGEATLDELTDLYVDVGVLFPENFLKIPILPDVEYATALARAYNDYLLDRFLDDHDELLGCLLVAPQDVDHAVEEIDRVGDDDSMCGVFLSVSGLDRTYGHPMYDPIWEAATEKGLAIAFHSGGVDYPEFPFNTHKLPYLVRHTLNHELSLMVNMMDIVVRGVPARYPDLEFGFLEGGLSWVPMAMHRLDREYMQHRDGAPQLEERPSAYMKEFFVGSHPLETPMDRTDIVRLIELIDGEDTIVFATDVPHHDFDHPSEINKLAIDETVKAGIWGENAARWLDL